MRQNTEILQLIDSLNSGGAEVLSVNIANALTGIDNYNSHLCVTRKEGELKNTIYPSVKYLFLNRKRTLDIKAILILSKYLKKNSIKVVHAHSTSIYLAFLVKILNYRIKLIWHDHYGKSKDLKNRKVLLLKVISIFINTIVSVNSDLRDWAKSKLYCKNVKFINNFPEFNNDYKTTILNGNSGKRVVHLAAFRPQKDHFTLIKAFEIFLKKQPIWTLHLVGRVNNDSYSDRVIKLIEEKNLSKSIFIYNSCLDIKNILNQSTIGVLSSKSEGLPLALLEYGLAGLSVITTGVGECAKVIEDKKSGLIIKSQDIISLSEALVNLANDKDSRNKYAKEHQKNVFLHYSKSSFINKIVKIYQ